VRDVNQIKMTASDTEKNIRLLQDQIKKIEESSKKTAKGVKERTLQMLNSKLTNLKAEMYSNLNSWQKVQLSRHPQRPTSLDYINSITSDFFQLRGDRLIKDDKAIIGGFASIDGRTVMIIAQQKGKTTKEKQYRNFGMPGPEGYRKSLRLMKLAVKFNKPIIIFIDTPGASTGIEAEERGQAEAIGRNISEMLKLTVPVVSIVIGEGASAGAMALLVADKVMMLEYTWYSVISPEACSSILWRNWDHREEAAEALKLTADDQLEFGFIDAIIKEPAGGAQNDTETLYNTLKQQIITSLDELEKVKTDQLIANRRKKYLSIGIYEEI
jgi:acetyl-CoA carboxylase carboxyl transferase subunit alpha